MPPSVFNGKKQKWLPLYRRLLVRLKKVPGIEVITTPKSLSIIREDQPDLMIGKISVLVKGLEISLSLKNVFVKSTRLKASKRHAKLTHSTLIAEIDEINDELLTWVRTANHQARTSKGRST